MKTKQPTADQLRNQLAAIIKKEAKDFSEKHYPHFKKFQGAFFKHNDTYGRGSTWHVYVAVTRIKMDDVYDTVGNGPASHYRGWSFQTTPDGHVHIEKNTTGYIHSLGKQISKREFMSAWKKMQKTISRLVK